MLSTGKRHKLSGPVRFPTALAPIPWGGLALSIDRDDDLASMLRRLKKAEGLTRLTKPVRPIDHRHKLAGFKQFAQVGQALVRLQHHKKDILLDQPADPGTQQAD